MERSAFKMHKLNENAERLPDVTTQERCNEVNSQNLTGF